MLNKMDLPGAMYFIKLSYSIVTLDILTMTHSLSHLPIMVPPTPQNMGF